MTELRGSSYPRSSHPEYTSLHFLDAPVYKGRRQGGVPQPSRRDPISPRFENGGNHISINPILRLAQTVDRRLRQAGDKSPGVRRLTKLFEVIHFTSLKTEEGKTLQLRIALVDPDKRDPDRPQLIRPDR